MQMVIYTRLTQSISVLRECLVDCYSISATTFFFHFFEQCGDPHVEF